MVLYDYLLKICLSGNCTPIGKGKSLLCILCYFQVTIDISDAMHTAYENL